MRVHIQKILNEGDRLLGTDVNYVAKGSFWLILSQFIFSISGLLLAVVYANLLPKDTYGNYAYILSLWGMISAFGLTGMGPAVTHAVSKGFEGTVRKAFWLSIRWSVLTIFIAFAGATYYYLNDNTTLAAALLVIGSFAPLLGSAPLYEAYLNGKKNFRATAWYGIFRNVFPVITMIISVFLTQDILLLVLLYFLANSIAVLSLYAMTLKIHAPNTQVDESAISYGKHLSLMNILNGIASYIDKILIFHHLGAIELAVYSFASALPEQIRGLFKKLYTLALPRFSQRTKDDLKQNIFKKVLQTTALGAIFAVFYIILAPYIFAVLFPAYTSSVFYSQLIALTLVFSGGALTTAFFESQQAIKQKYTINIINSLSKIILIFALVVPYGILGVIIARISARIIVSIVTFVLVKRF